MDWQKRKKLSISTMAKTPVRIWRRPEIICPHHGAGKDYGAVRLLQDRECNLVENCNRDQVRL